MLFNYLILKKRINISILKTKNISKNFHTSFFFKNYSSKKNLKRLYFLEPDVCENLKYNYLLTSKKIKKNRNSNDFLSKVLSKYFFVLYRRNKKIYKPLYPTVFSIKRKKQKVKSIREGGRIFYKRKRRQRLTAEEHFYNRNFQKLIYLSPRILRKFGLKKQKISFRSKLKKLTPFERGSILFFKKIKNKRITRFNFFKKFLAKKGKKRVIGYKFAFIPYNFLVQYFSFYKRSKFFYKFYDIQLEFLSLIRLVFPTFQKIERIYLYKFKNFFRGKKIDLQSLEDNKWSASFVILKIFYYFYCIDHKEVRFKNFFFFLKKRFRLQKCFYRPYYFKFSLDRSFKFFFFNNNLYWKKIKFNRLKFKKFVFQQFFFFYNVRFFKKYWFKFNSFNSFYSFTKIFFLFFHFFGLNRLRFFNLFKLEKYKERKKRVIFFTKLLSKRGLSYLVFNILTKFNFNCFSSFNSNLTFFLKRRRLRFLLKWTNRDLGGSFLLHLLLKNFNFNFFKITDSSFYNYYLKVLFSGKYHNFSLIINRLNLQYFSEVFNFNFFSLFFKTFLRKKFFTFKFLRYRFKLITKNFLAKKGKKRFNYFKFKKIKSFLYKSFRNQFFFNFVMKNFKVFEFKNEIELNDRYLSFFYSDEVRKLLYKETLSVKEILSVPQRTHNYVKRRHIFDLSILNLNLKVKNMREVIFDFVVSYFNSPLLYISKIIGGFYHKALAQHFLIFDYGYKNYVYLPLVSTYISSFDFLSYTTLSDFECTVLKFYKFFVQFLKYNFKRIYKYELQNFQKKFDGLNEFFFSEIWSNSSNITRSFSDNFINYNYGLLENSNSIIKKNRLYGKLFSNFFNKSLGKITFLRFSNNKDLYSGETFSIVHVFKYFIKRDTLNLFGRGIKSRCFFFITRFSNIFYLYFSNLKLVGFFFFKLKDIVSIFYNITDLIKFFIFYFLFFKLYKKFLQQYLILNLLY